MRKKTTYDIILLRFFLFFLYTMKPMKYLYLYDSLIQETVTFLSI